MTGSINRRLRVALTLVVGLVSCVAMAANAYAVVPGGIVQLSGAAGCISDAGAPCTSGHDLGYISEMAISPDGRNLYATGYLSGALTIFDRNPQTGALTQKPGTSGCFRNTASATCQALPALGTPFSVTLSPDGNHVYVAGYSTDTILAFSRNPDGSLTPKAGAAGCVSNAGTAPCGDARALNGPAGLRVSPDGKHLYAAAWDDGSIVGFTIGADGGLTQITDGPGGAGCIQNVPGPDGCADGRALAQGYLTTMGPDGAAVYTTTASGTLSSQARDAATGRLSAIPGVQGCVVSAAADGCTVSGDLSGYSFDVIATGSQIYVASMGASRVVTFDRQPSGGVVRRAGAAGCLTNGPVAGCTTGRALDSATGIALSADGEDVYVAARGANTGVVELGHAADGTLTPTAGTRGCAVIGALFGCAAVAGMSGSAHDVAVSPDNRFVYLSTQGAGIAIFKRDSSGPVCNPSTVTVQAGSVGPLSIPCSDPDGDALTFSLINPPTLGSLGAIDNAAGTVVYAAPQGQNGTTTITFKAAYSGFEAEGSLTVNVVGAATGGGGGGGGGGTPQPSGIDNDKDGFFAGQDCNDANAAIRPGAVEVKGNNLDENCDGLAEPFPTLTSGVASKWDVKGNSLTMTLLQVTQQFPKGWKVVIKCSGKPKCSFKTKTLKAGKVSKGASTVISSLSKKQRKFKAGQTVEVWVSAPNFNTKVARLVLRKGKIPTTQPFCVIPGQTKPQKTCS